MQTISQKGWLHKAIFHEISSVVNTIYSRLVNTGLHQKVVKLPNFRTPMDNISQMLLISIANSVPVRCHWNNTWNDNFDMGNSGPKALLFNKAYIHTEISLCWCSTSYIIDSNMNCQNIKLLQFWQLQIDVFPPLMNLTEPRLWSNFARFDSKYLNIEYQTKRMRSEEESSTTSLSWKEDWLVRVGAGEGPSQAALQAGTLEETCEVEHVDESLVVRGCDIWLVT